MITTGQRWMAKLLMWISGTKHPDTPKIVFKNVWEYDRLRKILKRRCAICDYVISADADKIRELLVVCGKPNCNCAKIGSRIHEVCSLCYDMWHAIYFNERMKNMVYFKEIDEREAFDRARERGTNRNNYEY